MKDTIKLHEICGYLPYGMKAVDYFDGIELKREIVPSNIMVFVYGDTKAKPILRPLSDLTKEIEHNGKRFVPSTELRLFIQADIDYVISSPTSCDYDTVKKLYEWHFDIHGLIDRNLALNLNDYEI